MAKSKRRSIKRESSVLSDLWGLIVWLVGILVALAVGFGMAYETLTIPWLTNVGAGVVTVTAGWFVVIMTILGVLLKLIDKIGK
jgi:hypothetical protein